MTKPWHSLAAEQVLELLQTDPQGLDAEQASQRLQQYGPNQLAEYHPPGLLRIFLRQFYDVMILVLGAAALISVLLGDISDSIVILVIVILNAVIGAVQEYRAERALQALKALAQPTVRVRRTGQILDIAADQLTPGDMVLLEAGNLMAADLRLLEANGLQFNEAALTGESEPVNKQTALLDDEHLSPGDRSNMAFRGTLVTRGRGEGVVVATGMQTEIGHIAAMLDGGSRLKTPLQQRLQRFGKRLTGLILLICAVLFVVGLLRGEPAVLMFMTAVSLAVAAIPEALPAVVTIALALGARRMVHQQVLIRRLPAVETLGSVTYICSDKTGTLTKNAMRVAAFQLGDAMYELEQPPQHQQSALFLEAMALNNDAFSQGHGEVQGEPTETALYEALQTLQLDPVTMRRQKPRLAEIPFDSTRRMMTTFHAHDGAVIAYTKGAPEHVIPACRQQLLNDSEIALDQADMLARAEQLAGEGYRVLAIACRQWPQLPDDLDSEQIEHELVLLGLVALMDPPREEVAEAIETCRSAGIVPVMITGDHPTTAMAIARRIGLIESQEQRLLTGRDIEQLSDQALRDIVADTRVYARVAPEQKIRIVEALQQRGEYVAMTGDGVNDAPALRRANIGVAMGKVGTDVAREAADMVLLDDHFASIVNAVREGRRIFDNIRKFVRYTMSSNAGEIITLSLAPLFGMPLPLLPIHILWINLVTDGLPGLALSLEKQEPNIMQRPPRDPHESIMSGGMGWQIVWIGCLIGGLSLTAQAWALGDDSAHWQTMVFTVLTFSQLFNALAIRSERRSIFSQSLFDNSAMLGSVLLTFALQLVLIYTPLFQEVFRLQPLDLHELLVCIGLSALVLPAVELEKWLTRRGLLYRSANNSKARK